MGTTDTTLTFEIHHCPHNKRPERLEEAVLGALRRLRGDEQLLVAVPEVAQQGGWEASTVLLLASCHKGDAIRWIAANQEAIAGLHYMPPPLESQFMLATASAARFNAILEEAAQKEVRNPLEEVLYIAFPKAAHTPGFIPPSVGAKAAGEIPLDTPEPTFGQRIWGLCIYILRRA